MKLLLPLLVAACLSIAVHPAHAAPPRLALWITAPIGASDGAQCELSPDAATMQARDFAPTLTETDVIGWQRESGRWTLDPARFPADRAAGMLQDHCFLLAVDGTPLASGLVLGSHSARLTGLPTLSVFSRDAKLELQLTQGNHWGRLRLLHTDALNKVLAHHTPD